LGNATIIFSYNQSSLSFPNTPVEGIDYSFNAFQGMGYSSSVSKPLAGTIIINIVYNFSSGGSLLGVSYIPVVTLNFTTLDLAGNADLVWRDAEFFAPSSTFQWNLGFWNNEDTTPLPVELISFTASVENKSLVLRWTTATETNNSRFEVERSSDNSSFQSVGSVPGAGSSTEIKNYTFIVADPLNGVQYYRLKIIDLNGSYSYSQSIKIDISFYPEEFSLFQNYPNPFNPSTTIKYALPVESSVILTIFNSLGEKIEEFDEGIKSAGYHSINWQPKSLSSGMYFYSISGKSTDGKSSFNKTHKMLLMK